MTLSLPIAARLLVVLTVAVALLAAVAPVQASGAAKTGERAEPAAKLETSQRTPCDQRVSCEVLALPAGHAFMRMTAGAMEAYAPARDEVAAGWLADTETGPPRA